MNGVAPLAWTWVMMKAVPEPWPPSSSSVSTRTVENSSFLAMESISMVTAPSVVRSGALVELLDRRDGGALRLLGFRFGSHHGQAPEIAEGLDVDQGDVRRFLGLVGGVDDVPRRFHFAADHAFAGQDHRPLAQLAVDQRG